MSIISDRCIKRGIRLGDPSYKHHEHKHLYKSKVHRKSAIQVYHGEGYIPHILYVIRKFSPEMIVELGTSEGGMTLIFHEEFRNIPIHTFDVKEILPSTLALFDRKLVHFHRESLYPRESSVLIDLLSINKDIKKFMYSDVGTAKIEGFRYVKYLSSGDLFGTHDWIFQVDPDEAEKYLGDFVPFERELMRKEWLWTRFWKKK